MRTPSENSNIPISAPSPMGRTGVSVIKIGGNIIDDMKELKQFLIDFSNIKGLKILVHGGGKISDQNGSKYRLSS